MHDKVVPMYSICRKCSEVLYSFINKFWSFGSLAFADFALSEVSFMKARGPFLMSLNPRNKLSLKCKTAHIQSSSPFFTFPFLGQTTYKHGMRLGQRKLSHAFQLMSNIWFLKDFLRRALPAKSIYLWGELLQQWKTDEEK